MKSLRFLGTALIATLMCVACSNEEIAPEEQEAKYVTVDLGVTGEYLKVSESPLGTRTSTTTDTYGISVWTGSGESARFYAGGLFTSLENVKIKLLDGEKYHFAVAIYVDDKVTLDQSGQYNYKYYSENRYSIIDNDFTYAGTGGGGGGDINEYGNFKHDSYYGELNNYTPTENGTVEIATKRVVYGAHFIAEGLTEGNLNIIVGEDFGYPVNLTPTNLEDNNIYTFWNYKQAWFGTYKTVDELVEYYTTVPLTISWTKDDGSVTPLGTFNVTFKRNIKTTIVIKVADPSQQNGIVVTKEETRMTDDENKYVIEGGTITEVPVTSQQ